MPAGCGGSASRNRAHFPMGQWIQRKLLWMKYGVDRYPEQTTTKGRVRVKFAETEGSVALNNRTYSPNSCEASVSPS